MGFRYLNLFRSIRLIRSIRNFILMPKFYFIFFGLFIAAHLLRFSTIKSLIIPVDKQVKITGRIVSQPYFKNNHQIIQLENIYLTTDIYPEYLYGEKIEASGYFTSSPSGILPARYFTYKPIIKIIAKNETSLGQQLFRFRHFLEKNIKHLLPEPESSLFLGIMLGVKTNIPDNFLINLRNSGTIHMLVASGQNVVLIVELIFALLILKLNRRLAVILSLPLIILYCLITGAEAPVVRAGIMAGFSLLATLTGRLKSQVWGLIFAAGIMLLVNPLTITDVGFQLSFAATAGIIFVYPLLKKLADKKISLPAVIEESLLISLSAQITTLPIIV